MSINLQTWKRIRDAAKRAWDNRDDIRDVSDFVRTVHSYYEACEMPAKDINSNDSDFLVAPEVPAHTKATLIKYKIWELDSAERLVEENTISKKGVKAEADFKRIESTTTYTFDSNSIQSSIAITDSTTLQHNLDTIIISDESDGSVSFEKFDGKFYFYTISLLIFY